MRRAFDWVFRSRIDGRIVVAQRPNPSLWIFLAARVLSALLDDGTQAATAARAVATVALVWWSADELVRGVNPWRRFLGATVLALQVVALAR